MVEQAGRQAGWSRSPGNAHRPHSLPALPEGVSANALIADKAYDTNAALVLPDSRNIAVALPSRARRISVRAGRAENAVDLVFSTDCVFQEEPDAHRRMVSGRPEQIAADLRQYQDLGVQHFILSFPANSASEQQEAMERFARAVMPLIPAD